MAIDLSKNFEGLMEYPEEFQKKCLELYPDNKKIIDLLSKKSFLLYNELVIPDAVTDEEILNAANKNDFTTIVEKSTERIAKLQLRSDFYKLYDNQYLSEGKYVDKTGIVVSTSIGNAGNMKEEKCKVKDFSSHFSETEIRIRNQRRKNGSEEAGKFICN